ncbi:hypothetical protein [Streptomyces aureocirculatus]|uniref:hypothetical protein n=1 Tax=Streptomyces aureocirculatus TaxID=67275 RepID=UPI0004C59524|nr:hypothetical protein [Streptomyces aureocirculatus]
MPTRHFTREQLAALSVPPASPKDVEYDPDLLADEHVTVLKYTQQRRVIFRADDDRTYAVEYEAPLDIWDFEVGDGGPDDHGWLGPTVEAVEVEEQPIVVQQWRLITEPRPEEAHESPALHHLAEIYGEAGHRDRDAQQYAADLLAKHARELAALLQGERAAVYDDAGQRTADGVARAANYLQAYARGLAPDA